MNIIDANVRIQALERQVARQRRMSIVFMCAVIGILAAASLPHVRAGSEDIPNVVKAKAFHVVSDQGVMLAELSAVGDTGCVATYDSKDRIQTAMGSGDEGGGYITCFNKKGEIQVNLGGDQDGGQVVVYAKSGTPRVELSGDGDGGFVSAFDTEGTPQKLR